MFSSSDAGHDTIKQTAKGTLIRDKFLLIPNFRQQFLNFRQNESWCKVTVNHNKAFTQLEIINEVLPAVFNNHCFFPCYYKRFEKHDEFFLYRNFDALKCLVEDHGLQYNTFNLRVNFTLLLNVAPWKEGHIKWFKKINDVVTKRLGVNHLNLDRLGEDPELGKMVVSMNSKNNVQFLIDHAKRQSGNLISISAQHNSISTMSALDPLLSVPKLVKLDLRFNDLGSFRSVPLASTVKELYLDGNPICERFSEPVSYVSEIKKSFCSLEWLDGCRIEKSQDFAILQNFITNREAVNFTQEFVKDFFNVFDSSERQRILSFYTPESMLSITTNFAYDKSEMNHSLLKGMIRYTTYTRNLKFLTDFTKAKENLFIGEKIIGKVFNDFPATTHDCKNFCVDVPLFNPRGRIVITVTGSLKEQNSSLVFGFSRTFILHGQANHQYIISNDKLSLFQANQAQKVANEVVGEKKATGVFSKPCADLFPTEAEEKKFKLILFQKITGLDENSSFQRLLKVFWDLKVALVVHNSTLEQQ